MKSQKSSMHEGNCLYLVATPIGNLEDITMRALNVLKNVDVIAAEDTRNTKKLCNFYEIHTPLISYHEHNTEQGGEKILQNLRVGKSVALVSDAGLPCISDPGKDIVEKAISEDFAVVPIPGANAALSALIASGISPQPFYFFGFLNRNKKERRKQLESLAKKEETIIFYEAPHRLKETLKDMIEIMGDRNIVLARELTKKYEEFLRGSTSQAVEWAANNDIRGEFCIVLEGNKQKQLEEAEAPYWSEFTVIEHIDFLVNEHNYSSKEAIKQVAKERGMNKRDVYQIYHR